MDITYRPARSADLDAALAIVHRAINDLQVRHGFPSVAGARVPAFQGFCLDENPEGLWVAEKEAGIVGFGFAWMVEKFWFLSQLFIDPDAQAKGIGQSLLSKVLGLARAKDADNRTLITFPYNTAAIALYVRNGMYPREPLYRMSASAAVIERKIPAVEAEKTPIGPWPAAREWINRIDDAVLGFHRDSHHRFQLAGFAARAVELRHAGRAVGYAYISGSGHIGPAAIAPGVDPRPAVTAAIGCALNTQSPRVSMVVPGRADQILAMALGLGFRIEEPYVLMSARPFGDWRSYLPSNPGYM